MGVKVGETKKPTDKKWKFEVILKYHEPITEDQARSLLQGIFHLGLYALQTNEQLPKMEILP